ncbi:hypothetical protein ABT160_14565 [Streptomyces sp. NPDC001941]|uniref:hypothetical protein n=1 Tax=Streptomyces sp. NPDC001941 TaxID=3154659 RepID=UPI0033208EA6
MTEERILAVCRTSWEYRGVDGPSVRAWLDELAGRLALARESGLGTESVVGDDVRAFAARWARERVPFGRRLVRMVCLGTAVLGVITLLSFLLNATTLLPVEPSRLVFLAILAVGMVLTELRRDERGARAGWAATVIGALAAGVLADRLVDDAPLFHVPLWGAALLLLPGLPHWYADARGRRARSAPRDDG